MKITWRNSFWAPCQKRFFELMLARPSVTSFSWNLLISLLKFCKSWYGKKWQVDFLFILTSAKRVENRVFKLLEVTLNERPCNSFFSLNDTASQNMGQNALIHTDCMILWSFVFIEGIRRYTWFFCVDIFTKERYHQRLLISDECVQACAAKSKLA